MVRKWESVGARRILKGVFGLGLAIPFLIGITSLRGQDANPVSPTPPLAAAKAPAQTVSTIPSATPAVSDYTVSPEDLLDVVVMDVPEVSRTYRVSSNGLLTLPLLTEPITAAGQTLDQLGHMIATRFHDAGMLNNAQVSVSLRETRLHTVLVSGEVKSPGSYPLYGPTRLIDVLIKSGGLVPTAGDFVIISRGDAGEKVDAAESSKAGRPNPSANGQSFTLNIRKLMETGDDNTSNIYLYPGDHATVQRAQLIYVLGAVAHPGGYVLSDARQHMTVLKALAMAGDVNNIAKRSRIRILRKDPAVQTEQREEIPVDYPAIAKGKRLDIPMQADDILFVPESGGLKALHAGTQAAISVASTGGSALLIYH